MKTALLIPAFNAGERLRGLLNLTRKYFPPGDTFIIDDGSDDGCAAGLETEGFKVIRHRENMGKGAALKSGFRRADREGCDWALTMDADGQHDPEAIPAFIAAAERGGFGLLIGYRRQRRSSGMPWDRRFSNFSTSLLLSLISGRRIRDAQCGYRMYRMDFIRELKLKTSAFDTENELLLHTFKRKIGIGWVSVPTIYSGGSSHIRRLQDTKKFLRLVFKYILTRRI